MSFCGGAKGNDLVTRSSQPISGDVRPVVETETAVCGGDTCVSGDSDSRRQVAPVAPDPAGGPVERSESDATHLGTFCAF